MRLVALALLSARECLGIRPLVTLAALECAFVLGGGSLAPAAPGPARSLAVERALYAGVALLGGLFAAFVGAASLGGEIRSGRVRILLARPVGPGALFLGKGLGAAAASAACVAALGLAGWGTAAVWEGGGANGAGAPVAWTWLRGETPPSDARGQEWTPFTTPGDSVRVRFSGVPRLRAPDPHAGRIRVPVRRLDHARNAAVPATLVIGPGMEAGGGGGGGGGGGRREPIVLHALRDAPFSLRPGDVAPDGRLVVELRGAGVPFVAGPVPPGIRVRAGHPPYAGVLALRCGAIAAGAAGVALLGAAAGTFLSFPPASLLALFFLAAGFLRPCLRDAAAAIARGDLVGRPAAEGAAPSPMEILLRLDRRVLEAIAAASPPLDRLQPGGALALAEAPSISGLLGALASILPHLLGAAAIGWLVARLRSYP